MDISSVLLALISLRRDVFLQVSYIQKGTTYLHSSQSRFYRFIRTEIRIYKYPSYRFDTKSVDKVFISNYGSCCI